MSGFRTLEMSASIRHDDVQYPSQRGPYDIDRFLRIVKRCTLPQHPHTFEFVCTRRQLKLCNDPRTHHFHFLSH